MNKLTLSGATDFALTTDALAFMQSAYEALEKFGALGGDNYILSGCTVSGSSVTAGWMVLKGKLMPFQGGTIQTNVRIVTTTQSISVDVASREQTTYYAEFGTSANAEDNVAWADIKRPNTTIYLSDQISTLLSSTIPGLGQDINAVEDRLDILESENQWYTATLKEGEVWSDEVLALKRVGSVVSYYCRFRFNTSSPVLYPVWDLPSWAIPSSALFSNGKFLETFVLFEAHSDGYVNIMPAEFWGAGDDFTNELRITRGLAEGPAIPSGSSYYMMSGTYLL